MDDENATCGQCGSTLQLVRPGKHQCDYCEQIAVLTTQRDEASKLAGEMLAIVRVNHARGCFAEATMEQIEDFLKPYDARLRAIRPPFRPDQFRDAAKMISPTNAATHAPGANEKPLK